MGALAAYKSRPGATSYAPSVWPEGSRLPRVVARPTLVMFAHPGCPCTRASLDELAWLQTRFADRVDTYVVFMSVGGVGADAPLVERARTVPSARLVMRGAAEARLFGVTTSGHTLFYDSASRLRFSGGITAARGHAGTSAGRAHLAALLAETSTAPRETPAYGCALGSLNEGGK